MRRLLVLVAVLSTTTVGMLSVPNDAQATVAGDRGRIAFDSDLAVDGPDSDIYIRAFAGGTPIPLTTNTIVEDTDPNWSPDGSKIAYVSKPTLTGKSSIWVVPSTGGSAIRISPTAANDITPAWSPDGSKIAFSSDRDGTYDIWIMSADGTSPYNATADWSSTSEFSPDWSPDGTRLVFDSDIDGQSDVWVMNAVRAGTGRSNLTNAASKDFEPAWSPSGAEIVFRSNRHNAFGEVYVMEANGDTVRRITTNSTPEGPPAWSPDGAKIAFPMLDGDWDLVMVNPDGTDLGKLTDNPAAEHNPAWESVNRVPIAVDDSLTVATGASADIDVGVNDSDPDGDSVSATKASDPAHGTVVAIGPTMFRYTHDGSATVSDSFTYTISDSRGGTSTPATVTITVTSSPKPPPAAADTVGLVDPGTGEWYLRNSAGAVTSFFYGNPGDVPFMGDWDGDGVATPGLFRQSDAFAYLRDSNSQGIADIRFFFGNPSDIPLAGDWNGDGNDTLSIYRPSEQRFYIINELGENEGGLGAADYSFLFGNPGDKPVVGDWDGDGIDEVGLHRESTGFFYWRNTLDTGVADGEIFFGDPGDRFVAGDWGVVDGMDTPGLFRPSDVTFYFRHTLTQGVADSQFTWTGAGTSWLPVAGQFGLG